MYTFMLHTPTDSFYDRNALEHRLDDVDINWIAAEG